MQQGKVTHAWTKVSAVATVREDTGGSSLCLAFANTEQGCKMDRGRLEELERLEGAVRQAQDSVTAHMQKVTEVWYGNEAPEAQATGTLDHEWVQTFQELRAQVNEAQGRLDDYIAAHSETRHSATTPSGS